MNVLFVGSFGFPKTGTASDVRLSFMANTISDNNRVFVLNRYASSTQLKYEGEGLNDSVKIIDIVKSRNTNKCLSLVLFMTSILLEPFYILHLHLKQSISIIHIYSGHYIDFLLYFIISRIIGAKIVYQYVEYRSAIKRKGLYHNINGWLCDKYGPFLWDGVIPISHFLEEKALQINKKLISLQITPLCDFPYFDSINEEKKIEGDYMLYCGSVGYKEPIDLIVESFKSSRISDKTKLVLILNGDISSIDEYRDISKNIVIISNLSYSTLISYYKHATLLLIPLRNTIQDIARFPNKICEYLASRGIILTTNCGEMKYYFKDGQNAIVAEEFSVNSYSTKMDEIFEGKYDLIKIRRESYKTGIELFSVSSYVKKLDLFLCELVS